MTQIFKIIENTEHGLSLCVFDVELADRFDDYLTEECFVLYKAKFNETSVEFYFGQIGDPLKLQEILDNFQASIGERGGVKT